MKVPFGAFMRDRAFVPGSTNPNNNIPTALPVNVGVIKCGTELILFDTAENSRTSLRYWIGPFDVDRRPTQGSWI